MNGSRPRATNIVCHLDARYGGMSTSVPALASCTAQTNRYDVDLFALCSSDEVIDQGMTENVNLRCLPLSGVRGFADLVLYRSLRRTMTSTDVVHIHGIWQEHSVIGASLARGSSVPVVVSAHGMLESWAIKNKRWKKAMYSALVERRNLRGAACLRALTSAEVDDYRTFGLSGPIAVIPNGITAPTNVNSAAFLDRFPTLRSRRLVLFLSRIHYKKGLEPLCRAWARVSQRFPEASLVLAGPDFENTRSAIESLISELGIGESVVFTGMLSGESKWAALAAAALFVLPSFSEGFSVAILEAMAMGCPVLITRQCNFNEVDQIGCGLVIEPLASQIESSLDTLLRMPQARLQDMGARARSLVDSRYNWTNIGNQMADVYDWLLGGAKPSSVEICA
jgi:glycosyltransferase involved in cell wall biosynthesis